MYRSKAQSIKALAANSLVEDLQQYFVQQLNALAADSGEERSVKLVEWLRDQGRHGGGMRYVVTNEQVFNRGSINVSQVHYDDDQSKQLASATALSTIIHPQNPFAPSVHMHISWTEMKDGKGYWRMMADLNPAIKNDEDKTYFSNCLQQTAFKQYDLAVKQGDQYFYIPALKRHRGILHFYLEQYSSDDAQADFNLASALGKTVIDCYLEIVHRSIEEHPEPRTEYYKEQLAYHTLYLFQVLTLDRGTTSGLLVHDQNDLGIMGSLPACIDKALLGSWKEKLKAPQDKLLHNILETLPDGCPCMIDDKVKLALARVVRQHYKSNPEALSMQAKGDIIPATVNNHGNN